MSLKQYIRGSLNCIAFLFLVTPFVVEAAVQIHWIKLFSNDTTAKLAVVHTTDTGSDPDWGTRLTIQSQGHNTEGQWVQLDANTWCFEASELIDAVTISSDDSLDLSMLGQDICTASDQKDTYNIQLDACKPRSVPDKLQLSVAAATAPAAKMEFHEYPHLSRMADHFKDSVRAEPSCQCSWIVTEKMNGSLVCLTTNGQEVRPGSHHQFMGETSGIKGKYKELLYCGDDETNAKDYRQKIRSIFEHFCQPGELLVVYGEFFGTTTKFKSPSYTKQPDQYRVFDIAVVRPSAGGMECRIVDHETFQEMRIYAHMPAVPLLAQCTMGQALDYNPELISTLFSGSASPPDEDDKAEGVIVKPVNSVYFSPSANDHQLWVCFKMKYGIHAEASRPKAVPGLEELEEKVVLDCQPVLEPLKSLINEGRARQTFNKQHPEKYEKKYLTQLRKSVIEDAIVSFEREGNPELVAIWQGLTADGVPSDRKKQIGAIRTVLSAYAKAEIKDSFIKGLFGACP
ncbi:RNA ligase family protein [Spongorhabdus nitratireducens]